MFVTTASGSARILAYPSFEPLLMLGEKEEFVLNGHTSSCLTAQMQPSGRYLATGGSDSIISLWDTTDWICQRTLTKMVGPVKSLSMSFLPLSCWGISCWSIVQRMRNLYADK